MPLHDWIDRYPGVKRLLEQPEDVLEGLSVPQPAPDMLVHPRGLPISILPTAWASVSRLGRG